MRITNKTRIDAQYLRRLTGWVMKEMGISQWDVTSLQIASSLKPRNNTRIRKDYNTWKRYRSIRIWVSLECVNKDPHGIEAAFELVARLSWELAPIAKGDYHKPTHHVDCNAIRLYQQPIGKVFAERGPKLIESWKRNRLVTTQDPNTLKLKKLKHAETMLKKWEARHKLATTKLKVWRRRVSAAQRSLQPKQDS